jgi:hypothetical protein
VHWLLFEEKEIFGPFVTVVVEDKISRLDGYSFRRKSGQPLNNWPFVYE